MARYYKTNSPRLPQLAMYAMYQCLVDSVLRYDGCDLEPLKRMKSADRKSGTVGDIVLLRSGLPAEAVETKLGEPITEMMVLQAIDKIRTATVDRYFILSTAGVRGDEADVIRERCDAFRKSNGCEIIVNGVLETLRYYMRLIESQAEFVSRYAQLVEVDADPDYEHRVAWNELCHDLGEPS